MLHRIRLAMQVGSFEKFDGEVETDETYVGGRAKFMHANVRKAKNTARAGTGSKSMVVGTLQRGTAEKPSQVRAEVILDTAWHSVRAHVRETTVPGANLYTDAASTYEALRDEYKHEIIEHRIGEYARGRISTNGIENFWMLLKRGLKGTYVHADPEHLHRYVDERVFTFNERQESDLSRFAIVLGRIAGRRLTYADLTGKL